MVEKEMSSLGARVLVTGASGFLGGRLVRLLAAAGKHVIGVSRTKPLVDCEWKSCDVEDAGAVAQVFRDTRPESVFHLASHVTGSRDLGVVLSTFRANLGAAVHVMTAACEVGCPRVVLAGSMEELPTDQPARYPYAIAKRAAHQYAEFFRTTYGLNVTSTRIGMVYGPGQRDTAKLVPYVILSGLAGRAPSISSGKRRVDWIHVDDVCRALVASATTLDLAGAVIEIGTGRLTSVREIADLVTTITGGPPPQVGTVPDRPNDIDIALDVAAAHAKTGWTARLGLEQGLRDTVEWFREERLAGRVS
jgi:nucleoside-diphosphate-sugar epimerase